MMPPASRAPLAVAVGISVALRAAPFAATRAVRDAPLLADIGEWMPLGRHVPGGALPVHDRLCETGAEHWRARIVAGTSVCLLIANAIPPR